MTGQDIRQKRQAAKISAAELAASLVPPMAVSTLTYIERAFIPLKPEDAERIEVALRVLTAKYAAALAGGRMPLASPAITNICRILQSHKPGVAAP